MPKTLQLRRDTTVNLASEAGAVGELFVDTTKDTVVVMDGSTAGGFPLAKESTVIAANVGMVGYVGNQVTTANLGMVGYVGNQVTTANLGMIGYVGNQVTTANLGMIGYVGNQVTTANLGMIGYVGNQVTTANLGMKGYVDSVAGGSYSNVQVATYLPTYSGNIANVRLGTSGVLTFADGTTQTTASSSSSPYEGIWSNLTTTGAGTITSTEFTGAVTKRYRGTATTGFTLSTNGLVTYNGATGPKKSFIDVRVDIEQTSGSPITISSGFLMYSLEWFSFTNFATNSVGCKLIGEPHSRTGVVSYYGTLSIEWTMHAGLSGTNTGINAIISGLLNNANAAVNPSNISITLTSASSTALQSWA